MSTAFKLLKETDNPTLIGKAWWNQALKLTKKGVDRRLGMHLAAAVGIGVVGHGMFNALSSSDDDDGVAARTERRSALDVQRQLGWSYGAEGEALYSSVDASALGSATMRTTMTPQARWLPDFKPTLIEVLSAVPAQPPATPVQSPISIVAQTSATTAWPAAELGERMRDVWAKVKGLALIIDLAGEKSVAFAAGLASVFDPVVLFDNWPHPRGVVPADLTLAALAHHHGDFLKAKAARKADAPPAFVLDRRRLAPYRDNVDQFDNRWTAMLPSADRLKAAGVTRVLYVDDNSSPIEADDVVDELYDYRVAGLDVRGFQLVDVSGDKISHAAADFAARYAGWADGIDPRPNVYETPSSLWRPTLRETEFSTVQGAKPVAKTPRHFGEVPVAVAAATGAVLGAAFIRSTFAQHAVGAAGAGPYRWRSGSRGRTTSWSFGGG